MAEALPTKGLAARRAALQMLESVLRQGRTLESAASASRQLEPSDRALALAIAGEALRRLPDIDDLVDSATSKRLPDDSKARMVLRLALAQKIGLDTPDHAVVSTALPLVDGGPRRLVHGVLGTLLRRKIPQLDAPRLPPQVESRWAENWGPDVVEAARRQIAKKPPLDLSFKSDEAAQDFAAAAGASSLAPRHLRLEDAGAIAELPGFKYGEWWVQDLGASIPARLVPPAAGEVLDLCSAPGGKTMQMASAGHDVTAVDLSEQRLKRLAQNLERTGLSARLVCADALTWQPQRQFDSVLLDAPCSATGTYRRHPEVLYRARPRIIAEAAEVQAKLIARAALAVRPGGALVYSVCSLEPEEGERIVSDFLSASRDFEATPPLAGELPGFVEPTAEGWVRILPGLLQDEGGLDGFFSMRLVRRA
ncbi:MAG TPA: RsmB/NOP family class I SAM-dependent RNA methyltransferase [Sphingomicrobium sp.]|nr:RsmB/NOP family class I SAM-dependent RNA methyltransferase [Sphingomicrobium sp.]